MGYIYCANPLKIPNHRIRKKFLNVLPITNSYLKQNKEKLPLLQLGMYLCVGCKIQITKLPLRQMHDCTDQVEAADTDMEFEDFDNGSHTSNPELDVSLSSCSISSDDNSLMDTEYSSLEAEHTLETVTGALSLNMFTTSDVAKLKLNDAHRLYNEISEAITKCLSVVAGDSTLTFSSGNLSQNSCQNCIKLVHDLQIRFVEASTKLDKYKILTCLPNFMTIESVVSKFGCTQYIAREASKLRASKGAFTFPVYKEREGISDTVKGIVRDFYLSTENSRINPAVRGTIMVKSLGSQIRTAEAKRLIMMTLSDLYVEFCQKHSSIEISISSFALLRPTQCVWSGSKGFQNTCTCVQHQNFELMMNACKLILTMREVLASIFCSTDLESCMLGLCNECPKEAQVEKLFDNIREEDLIKYNSWGNADGQYGIQLLTLEKPVFEFQQEVKAMIPSFAAHHFVMKKQQAFFAMLKSDILRTEPSGSLQVDFAQNYAFLYPNEVQSFYYTNKQATVHPAVFSWYSKSCDEIKTKSFVVISDDLNHNATTVHAFLSKVLEKIKVSHPRIRKIYYISDGAASQYKNLKNFANLLHHKSDFGLEAEWHFSATSHGKGQCDAIGAVTKRSLRLESLKLARPGELQFTISTALDMYNHCNAKLSSITLEFLLVDSRIIDSISRLHNLEHRYSQITTIPGTRSHHAFLPVSETEIELRRFSLSNSSRKVVVHNAVYATQITIACGQFIAVTSGNSFVMGMVTNVNADQQEYIIQKMKKGKGNNFSWFEPPIEVAVVLDNVIKVVDAPMPTSSTMRAYRFTKPELDSINDCIKKGNVNK